MADAPLREPAFLAEDAYDLLTRTTRDEWTEGTLTELALRLRRLDVLTELVRDVRGDIAQTLADSMEADTIDIPGLGLLTRTETTNSAWREKDSAEQLREDLGHAIAAEIATDIATGEIDPMKRNVARATLSAVWDVVPSFSSIKAAGPKRFGVRISDYRSYGTSYKVTVAPIGGDL